MGPSRQAPARRSFGTRSITVGCPALLLGLSSGAGGVQEGEASAGEHDQVGGLELRAFPLQLLDGPPAPRDDVVTLVVHPAAVDGVESLGAVREPGPVPDLVGMPALLDLELDLMEGGAEPGAESGLLEQLALPAGAEVLARPQAATRCDPARRHVVRDPV